MASSMQGESAGAMGGTGGASPGPSSSGGSGIDISGADIQDKSFQQIMPLLQRLDPAEFTEAGAAFHELGSVLDDITSDIMHTGETVASNGSWKGKGAQAAMTHMQGMHDQASVLASQCHQAGYSLEWFGNEAIPPYKNLQTPQLMSKTEADSIIGTVAGAVVPMPGAGTAAGAALGKMGIGPNGQATADKAARDYMTSFNQQIGKVDTSLPSDPSIDSRQSEPWQQKSASTPGASGAPLSGFGGSSAASAPSGTGSVASPFGASQSANPFAGTAHQQAKAPTFTPSNASLQSYTPPAAPRTPTFTPASSAAGGGSPFGGGAMMPGGFGGGGAAEDAFGPGGKGGLGKDSPVEDEPADSSPIGAAGEGTAAEEAAGAKAAGAAEGEGGSGMPMGGSGGGGGQDKERQRQAWMNQDSEIWGAPTEDIGSVLE